MSTERKSHRVDHETLIRNPKNWQLWPFLPVKRRRLGDKHHDLPELGVLLDSPKTPITTVHLCNLYDFSDVKYAGIPTITYTGVAEMLDDGWVVD